MSTSSRVTQLRRALADQNLDALVVSDGVNRRYLSGFTGSAGWLIISPSAATFATDSRYYEQVGQQAPEFKLERVGYEFVENLGRMLSEAGAKRVGFEAKTVTVAEYQNWLKHTPGIEWVATEALVEGLRAVKDAAELDKIRASVALTDEVFSLVTSFIAPGMTESHVGWEIEKFFRQHGAQNWTAGPIVASGPNSALPHARPTGRRIQAGEPITIDLGCIFEGYHSDMTRTIVLGHADSRFEEVYGIVLQAVQAAEAGVKTGAVGKAVDALARDLITAAGYGDNFGHGLGHGVGLPIHEAPSARKISEDVLGEGMTLTIEPGIYLPGWGGVRIEDLLVVGADGAEILTKSPKSLASMVIPL